MPTSQQMAQEIANAGRSQRIFLARLRALIRADDPAVVGIMTGTRLCPFGGGTDGERESCIFGHPGCECADWAAHWEARQGKDSDQ